MQSLLYALVASHTLYKTAGMWHGEGEKRVLNKVPYGEEANEKYIAHFRGKLEPFGASLGQLFQGFI